MANELNSNQIAQILPHRFPFALVDRITDYEPGQWAKGRKCVSVNEQFFCGHFPQEHVMPGVLILEAMFCAMALHDGYLPATINYQVPDPACDLDVVPGHGRSADVRYAMSNSLGFGGHNGSLLFKRWEA